MLKVRNIVDQKTMPLTFVIGLQQNYGIAAKLRQGRKSYDKHVLSWFYCRTQFPQCRNTLPCHKYTVPWRLLWQPCKHHRILRFPISENYPHYSLIFAHLYLLELLICHIHLESRGIKSKSAMGFASLCCFLSSYINFKLRGMADKRFCDVYVILGQKGPPCTTGGICIRYYTKQGKKSPKYQI